MRPGDFALGSEQSRASARWLVEKRRVGERRFTLIMDIGDVKEPSFSPWREGADGRLVRVCSLPAGMTLQEAERIVAKPGWKPSVKPSEPECISPPLNLEW